MLKYLIIGAGGVGGTLGAYLQRAGLPVSLLAHGETLETLRKKRLTLIKDSGEEAFSSVAAFGKTGCNETPDVIFFALRSCSIEGVLPSLERVATEHTVIIPLYNVFEAGEKLQKGLRKPLVTDGYIYMMDDVEEADRIRQLGSLMCVVYNIRKSEEMHPIPEGVKAGLTRAGAEMMLSDNIRRDCMRKSAYLSPHDAVGTYFYITATHLQREGEYRNFYRGLVHEVLAIAERMDIAMDSYSEVGNLKVVDGFTPEMTTSFQKDIVNMRKSKVDGLVYEMQRLGAAYSVPTPYYDEIIEALRSRGVE